MPDQRPNLGPELRMLGRQQPEYECHADESEANRAARTKQETK
jgi:hypothetical protein